MLLIGLIGFIYIQTSRNNLNVFSFLFVFLSSILLFSYFKFASLVDNGKQWRVGSVELVENRVNGFVFEALDISKIRSLVLSIDALIYEKLLDHVKKFSVDEKDLKQVLSYD